MLYLPYYDYNDGAFDVNDEYYNENEYIDAISSEYNKNKDIVFNSMLDYNNGSRNVFTSTDGQTYKFGSKASQNEDKVAYSSCEGVLYNEDGEIDTPEEEFETELSLWTKEHSNINAYKSQQGEEWAWVNEPQRNVKIAFKNKANDDVYAVLENCKIMDIVDRNMYIVFVEKISLIDRI